MPDPLKDTVTFTLSLDESETLQLMMGFAVGAAMSDKGDKRLAYRFLGLVNRINADNPHFRPYAIPPGYAEER